MVRLAIHSKKIQCAPPPRKSAWEIAYERYTLLKARECFDISSLPILYFAFVRSRLTYCAKVLGYLDPISRLQKRTLAIITFTSLTDPSGPDINRYIYTRERYEGKQPSSCF